MNPVKKWFKRNSHNLLFKYVSDFGRSIYRIYENRNHHIDCNGEERLLRTLSAISPKVIIDVGANIGDYALTASKYSKSAKIYAFEPVDTAFNKLKSAVADNRQIVPIEKGMYSESGTKTINFYVSSAHSSLQDVSDINGQPSRQLDITLLKGDDFIAQESIESIDLLKVDVEGVELEVFQGFEKAFENHKIKAVQFEYGNINIITKQLLYDFYKFFETKDYSVGKVYPKFVEFRDYKFKHEDFIGPNFVAVSNRHPELKTLLSK